MVNQIFICNSVCHVSFKKLAMSLPCFSIFGHIDVLKRFKTYLNILKRSPTTLERENKSPTKVEETFIQSNSFGKCFHLCPSLPPPLQDRLEVVAKMKKGKVEGS